MYSKINFEHSTLVKQHVIISLNIMYYISLNIIEYILLNNSC